MSTPFDWMFSVFPILFILVFVVVVVFIVMMFLRVFKSRNSENQTLSGEHPAVREREIIREVVKIRCSYCGNLYDESQDKCPYCGGPKS
jgi:uncharacterized membrane protein